MSIEEIKNIKKLQQMLKSEMELREYTYKCCQEAGKELAKHSLAWDGKEKNLVIQAMELNERFAAKEKECEEAKQYAQDVYDLWQALIESFNILQDEKIKLEQECEEWKEVNDSILTTLNVLAKSNIKLRETLEEIKGIAQKGDKEKGNLMRTWWFKDILQKISEVDND